MAFTKGGKSASPEVILKEKFIFYHPYESINFEPAGLLKIALIVTPLIIKILFRSRTSAPKSSSMRVPSKSRDETKSGLKVVLYTYYFRLRNRD